MTTEDPSANRTILVTGANRGIGRALVEEALHRGANRVHAGTRQPLAHPDGRVTTWSLDVTDGAQIQVAAESVDTLDVLVDNAGLAVYDDLGDCTVLEQHLAVNLFGPHAVTQAFLPQSTRSRGAVVNVLSVAAVAQAVFDGMAGGEDIFPDPMSASLAPNWPADPVKTLERENAALLGAPR